MYLSATDIVSDHIGYLKQYEKYALPIFKPFESENKICEFGDFRITAFDVPHNGTDCFGVFIRCLGERLIYMSDLEYCPYVFKSLKPHVLMVECNHQTEYVDTEKANYQHSIMGHCSLETCKGIIQANDNECLKQIILLHPSKGNLNKTEALAEIKAITDKPVCFAERGMVIEV